MQQYSYPLPSNSSNQLTLPLTRNLYHPSIVNPLQTSLVHNTNNSRPSTLVHHEAATTDNHLSAVSRDEEHHQQSQQTYGNHDARQSSSRRHSSTNRRNERNRKYRKHERTGDRSKSKQSRQRGDVPSRRNDATFNSVTPSDCETSFQISDLDVPETMYKISYPHYYEDDMNDVDVECSTDYHGSNSAMARQHQQQQHQQQPPSSWDRQSNRCNNTSQFATDVDESRNKMSKTRLSTGSNQVSNDVRAPSAPTIMQYAELHFRDVGQEIDV